MSNRFVEVLFGGVSIAISIGCSTAAAADNFQSAAGATGIGSGRLVPTVAAVLGLIGVVLGGRARARSRRASNGRVGATLAVVLGLISLVIGGLHTANSAGAFGTGNGLAGAIVAIVLGLVGILLGALALARSRRAV